MPKRTTREDDERLLEMLRMHEAGMSSVYIAQRTGLTPTGVRGMVSRVMATIAEDAA